MMVPGFPNFFIMYGPNTNSPILLFNFELQAKYVKRALTRVIRYRSTSIEVRRGVMERYDRWLVEKMQGSVWQSTKNYFRTESGRVVTNWPVSPFMYWALSRIPLACVTTMSRAASTRAEADAQRVG
jgi:hypothetical protein